MNNIQFTKDYEVKDPTRGTADSAGIDFFVPEESDEFIKAFIEKNARSLIYTRDQMSDPGIVIHPQESALIPSGIRVKIPKTTALIAFNKSGVATKKGLVVGACVIDADYEGIVHMHVINTSNNPVKVGFGEKLTQFILIPYFGFDIEYVKTKEELYADRQSERGAGGFGSTNAK